MKEYFMKYRCIIYIWCVFWATVFFCMHKSANANSDNTFVETPSTEISEPYLVNSKEESDFILGLMTEYNKKLSEEEREEYLLNIFYWAREYSLSPRMIASLIARESAFRVNCKSDIGAYGPCQIYIKQHKNRIKKLGLTQYDVKHNIGANIHVCCDIIREYLGWKSVAGNMEKALKIYSGLYNSKKYKTNWYYEDVMEICKTGKHPKK